MPYVWFALICSVWGSSFILMKKANLGFSPLGVGLGRILGGAAVLALIWWWNRSQWSLRRSDTWPLVCVVILGFAWPYSAQPYLVARHGSAFVGMTVAFTPLLTIIASVPVLGSFPTPRQTLGVLGALVCLGLLMIDGRDRNIPMADIAWALTIPGGYAFTNTIIRRCLRQVPALELTLFGLSVAAALVAPLTVIVPSPDHCGTQPSSPTAWSSVLILGVFGTGLAMFQFNRLVQEQGPLFAGMTTNLVPIGALLWAWHDGEPVTLLQVVALGGLLAMVALVQYGAASIPERASAGLAPLPGDAAE